MLLITILCVECRIKIGIICMESIHMMPILIRHSSRRGCQVDPPWVCMLTSHWQNVQTLDLDRHSLQGFDAVSTPVKNR